MHRPANGPAEMVPPPHAPRQASSIHRAPQRLAGGGDAEILPVRHGLKKFNVLGLNDRDMRNIDAAALNRFALKRKALKVRPVSGRYKRNFVHLLSSPIVGSGAALGSSGVLSIAKSG